MPQFYHASERTLINTPVVITPVDEVPQEESVGCRLLGCMVQVANAVMVDPLKRMGSAMWNHPKTSMLLFSLTVNAVAQSCISGIGAMAGAPQQGCVNAANYVGQSPTAVAGVAGTLFALAAHAIAREVGLHRSQHQRNGIRII